MTETPIWPDRLRIRDTGLHDDLGGPGQRIYTTAGRGYERQEYVRADLFDALTAERDALRAKIAEQQNDGTLMTPDQKLAWDAAFRRVFAVLDNSTTHQKTAG